MSFLTAMCSREHVDVACEGQARQLGLFNCRETVVGAIVMTLGNSSIVTMGAGLASVVLLGVVPSGAGFPVPAPLVGVSGPVGIVAAGVAYGGYLLFKRYRNRG